MIFFLKKWKTKFFFKQKKNSLIYTLYSLKCLFIGMTEVGIVSASKIGFNKVGATGLLAKGCKCKVGTNRKKKSKFLRYWLFIFDRLQNIWSTKIGIKKKWDYKLSNGVIENNNSV